MKKNKFFHCLFLVLIITLLTGCKKDKKNTPDSPETPVTPDAPPTKKEVQNTLDATWATYVITDIEQMCAFMGENELLNTFYTHIPGSLLNNQLIVSRNTLAKDFRMVFNDTRCKDGRFRQGTVFMHYDFDPNRKPGANPNSEYYDEYGFAGQLSLLNYRVDGWLIENYDPQFPAYVYNEMENPPLIPQTTKLKWKIVGKFKFTPIADSLKNRSMVWDGQIFKTLDNTSNPMVYSSNRLIPITWSVAICSYNGIVKGVTNSVDQFTMELGTSNNGVVRDFNCYPELGVQHHPFVKGVANFTTGAFPCNIYFGNELNPVFVIKCDSVGDIMIKGVHYNVNLIK